MRQAFVSVLPLLALLVLGGCQGLRIHQALSEHPSDWLTEGRSAMRQHTVPDDLAPPLEVAWKYNAGGGFGPASPLIVGNAVLVGTRAGEVHAVDLHDGKKLGQAEFGEAVEGSPAVRRGVLFVPVGWGRRAIVAYDLLRGETNWRHHSAPVDAGLLVHGESVIAADRDGNVRAYDWKSGELHWEFVLESGVRATPILAGDDLLVAGDGGEVAALDPSTGALRWSTRLAAPVYATPASDGSAVFLPTTRGKLIAIDARTGAERWAYVVPDGTVRFASPAYAGGEVVFGGSDGVLRAVDAGTGAVRWTCRVEGAVTSPPLVTDGVVYVGTMNSRLHAVDRRSGEIRWTHELDGRVKSPLAYKDGVLVVLAEPRTVYAFKPAGPEYAATN